MLKPKMCWVELGAEGNVIRIFRETKTYLEARCRSENDGKQFNQVPYAEAVSAIRSQVWKRSKGHCEKCANIITEQSLHLHERLFRSKGGEVSLDNSVALCYNCHIGPLGVHGNRSPQFGKNPRTTTQTQ